MTALGVMHVLDTLETGGAERLAVNLVNHLPGNRYRTYLCTTRRDGPLSSEISPDVGRLRLNRKGRFDCPAILRMARFLREADVRILHAHGASLFLARLAARMAPGTAVVWHAHYGRFSSEDRRAWHYRIAAGGIDAVVAVSRALVEWVRTRLAVPAGRISYLPNLVCPRPRVASAPDLPGRPGQRIACVANLRPEKDHLNLIRAMSLVAARFPLAHLLLVGGESDSRYAALVRKAAADLNLSGSISFLGPRADIGLILERCDIGVLGSSAEGLPLALLEYGLAGLPAVATSVGQCPEALDNGRAGLLVPAGDPAALASALGSLLASRSARMELGRRFRRHVEDTYTVRPVIEKLCRVYDAVSGARS